MHGGSRKHHAVLLSFVVLVTTAGCGVHRGGATATPQTTDEVRAHAVELTVQAQEAALLAGNESAWMATVDPDNTDLTGRFRAMFRSLRALRASAWKQATPSTVDGLPVSPPGAWDMKLRIAYCVGTAKCLSYNSASTTPSTAVFNLVGSWRMRDGRAVLTDERPRESIGRRPAPWESDLVVSAGKRVLVAAPPALAGKLPEAVAAADDAAAVADRYARFATPPAVYVVYLAGGAEWKTWYGGLVQEAGGYAIQLGRDTDEVVLDAGYLTSPLLPVVLRHEFGHVVTNLGAVPHPTFWLVEGIAEYVAFAGQPVDRYNRRADVRRFVSSGRWDGHLALDQAPVLDTSAGYGVAYLAMTCLAAHYGEDRMFGFFGDVVRAGKPVDGAAQARFGTPWATVDAECAATVRQYAR